MTLPLLVLSLSLSIYVGWDPWGGWLMRCRWEVLSYLVKLPLVGVSMLNTFLKFRSEHERPKFIAYSYPHIRPKPFPWGDGNHTPLRNPCVNRLLTAFEHG
uniref:Uncharacterized protein n=1 Tax=Neovison vison TaxID=452646 RepID=A0A8C7B4A0_NEOVI